MGEELLLLVCSEMGEAVAVSVSVFVGLLRACERIRGRFHGNKIHGKP